MAQIRVTVQVTDGPEMLVFGDEVTSERLCPALSIAENSVIGAVGALQTDAVIREYIGTHMVKSVEASHKPEKRAGQKAS